MERNQLQDNVVEYLKDAHAMETNVASMLDSMIDRIEDPQILKDLEHHREETDRHLRLVDERLQAYGEDSSSMKDFVAKSGAMFKSMMDRARDDEPGRTARDGFVTEHLEIASYELLERVALRAGDEATAEVARRNCADEQAMADKIADSWDRVVDQTIANQVAHA